jgi:hypothetical protein
MKHSISYRRPADPEALQARFALRVAARLDERVGHLGPDVAERLRFAREQALEKARAARAAVKAVDAQRHVGGATLAWTGGPGDASSLWVKVGSVLPLIVLVAGLILIQQWNVRAQIDAAAEIDAALLSDTLPPSAYSDPGFAEFLNTPRD